MKLLEQLKNGVVLQNPLWMQGIGMCPALATTTTLASGLGMGLATTAVLVCSNTVISLLRRRIPAAVRVAAYLIVIAAFAGAADLLLQAYLPNLSTALGIFVPLIAANCIVLGRAETFAAQNHPLPAVVDGFSMGLGFTLALSLLAAVREVLGTGILGAGLLGMVGISVPLLSGHPIGAFVLPTGGFLLLGCLLALVQKLRQKEDAP